MLLSAAVGALLSGLLWFVCSLANMSGTWAGVADREVLWTVLNETTFGSVWMARMLLTVIILGVTAVRPVWTAMAGRDLVTACLAAVLLASLAGTGHAQIEEGWIGGGPPGAAPGAPFAPRPLARRGSAPLPPHF